MKVNKCTHSSATELPAKREGQTTKTNYIRD